MPGGVGRTLFSDDNDADDVTSSKDRILTPVQLPDSLFQLEEQTEPQEANVEHQGSTSYQSPMASIEIRTFKMLNLVREHAKDSAAIDGSATIPSQPSDRAITTVGFTETNESARWKNLNLFRRANVSF